MKKYWKRTIFGIKMPKKWPNMALLGFIGVLTAPICTNWPNKRIRTTYILTNNGSSWGRELGSINANRKLYRCKQNGRQNLNLAIIGLMWSRTAPVCTNETNKCIRRTYIVTKDSLSWGGKLGSINANRKLHRCKQNGRQNLNWPLLA